MKTFTIAVIAGDGVGPEVIPQGKRVLEAAGKKHNVTFSFQDFDWGAAHFVRWGHMMPAGALDLLHREGSFEKLDVLLDEMKAKDKKSKHSKARRRRT